MQTIGNDNTVSKYKIKCIHIHQWCTTYGPWPHAARGSRVSGSLDLPQYFLKIGLFDVSGSHFFVNLWQLLMVLFQFIPNSGIFSGFQLLGSPQVSKCTISTFSVYTRRMATANKTCVSGKN